MIQNYRLWRKGQSKIREQKVYPRCEESRVHGWPLKFSHNCSKVRSNLQISTLKNIIHVQVRIEKKMQIPSGGQFSHSG